MKKQQKTVFVGLSGGVDSSVAALRLKKAGYSVVGVFIKVWHPDFLVCDWEAERLDAMRVAAHLDIPFLTCDAEEAYKQEVADYFIAEYTAGRTPNPDVFCNKAVKFGAFLQFAKAHGADYVATGHYAQRIVNNDVIELYRGVDTSKDQSYFLWTLTQEQLEHILLPIGASDKTVIRKEAAGANIPTAAKKDSQGICFLGHIDIPEFLSHYVSLQPGVVRDTTGAAIGEHQGALVYTVGQRHGFTISARSSATTPHYVVAKDIEQNEITVATTPPQADSGETITITSANWITTVPEAGARLSAQFHYHQQPVPVLLTNVTDEVAHVQLQATAKQPAAGQSCVLYDGMQCIGGGIVSYL